jgi:sensor histidine kinase YesM
MKHLKLIVIFILFSANLFGISTIFENKLKVFTHHDIKFFIGKVPESRDNYPNFLDIPLNAWKSIEEYRYSGIKEHTKVWFKIDLSGMIIPFNAIYFHSLKNELTVYYPGQIFPTKESQSSISNLNINSHMNKQIIILKNNSHYDEFDSSNIYFSIDIDQKTPLFKFFPILVGDEASLREYIINEEIIKRNTDYLTFFVGNFLIFVSLLTLIIFFIKIKNPNFTILFFTLLMATAGVFYWMLSPLSLFFSDFTFSRMLYILTFYHLIWVFFGLLMASFLKKKFMASISLFIICNLIIIFLFPKAIAFSRFSSLILLILYHILIIHQLNISKIDLLNTKLLFSSSAMLNTILLLSPLFLPRTNSITMFGPIGLGLVAWIISFAFFTYKQYIMTINELQMEKIKNLELTESNLQSQLNSLKKQLDPHFLFNSLGTLIALIDVDKECAIDYIQEFSNVYRYILDTHESNFVTLKEELDFCSAFIFLLKKRFEDTINTSIEIDKSELTKFVPPLSVQMLIENAIKHNIATEESPLLIKIYAQDNYLVVENILQLKKHNNETSKLGLKNLNQRLFLLKQINIVIIETDRKFIAKIPMLREV